VTGPEARGLLRAVVDVNLLISALINDKGAPAVLVDAIRRGDLILISCPHLFGEAFNLVERKKFRPYFSVAAGRTFLQLLMTLADMMPNPSEPLAEVCRDPDDDYLCALGDEAEATLIVTGDDDLLSLDGKLSTPVWTAGRVVTFIMQQRPQP
jgi:putative PIN family toxin of toxin-antitoxin system